MPPKFRITRATAQPRVTIYNSSSDLADPAAGAAPVSGGTTAVESIAASGDDGRMTAPNTAATRALPVPDLEDMIAGPIPGLDIVSSASTATGSTQVPTTPPGKVSTYTSLRRTTRSATRPSPRTASPSNAIKVEEPHPILPGSTAVPPSTPARPRKRVKREPATPVDQIVKDEPITPGSSQPRSAKKVMPLPKLEKPHPAPARWEEQYRLIERMRKGIIAPVDTMGCERPQLGTPSPKNARFHVLISLMLSSQTKDAITSQAVTNLHITLPGGLSAESLAGAEAAVVSECINKVGFWRRKTEYIQDAARLCLERYEGDVPDTLEGLCDIRGVGPKMAYLALQCAWEINAGIGVDVHVHRITNRLKWHKPPTQTAEQTRVNLESWLPSHLHRAINPMLVGFGQVICLPVGPRCDHCLLGAAKICPSRVANVNAAGRKEVVYTFTAEGDEPIMKAEDVLAKVEVGYEATSSVSVMQEEGRSGTPLESVSDSTKVEVQVKQETV